MHDRTDVEHHVRDALSRVRPGRESLHELSDDTALDSTGLGLDSVEVVEVLLDCEERYGVPFDTLLEGPSLTFGHVVDHFAAG